MTTPAENKLLIADPFLNDENFIRTVIYLCNHNEEGSFGLILNRPFEFTLNEMVTGLETFDIPVFVGGPVGLDTIHFLHDYHELIPDSQRLSDKVSWGGDFETVKSLLLEGRIEAEHMKFFLGYSGWSPGQLQTEIDEKTWIVAEPSDNIIFNVPADDVWKQSLKWLGGEYEQMINYPIDPRLN